MCGMRRGPGLCLAVVCVAAFLSSCSSRTTPRSASPPGPDRAALAWFAAINSNNAASVRSMMLPGSAAEQSWFAGRWAPSQWPAFTRVSCRPLADSGDNARVECSFDESQAPSVGNPDSFWDIGLRRGPSGSWLVSSYGQG